MILIFIKELLMQKELRREKYLKRKSYSRSRRAWHDEQESLIAQIKCKMEKLDLVDIIEFIQDQYDHTVKRFKSISNKLNSSIIKRIYQVKNLWRIYNKQRIKRFLQQHHISYKSDAQFTEDSLNSDIEQKSTHYVHVWRRYDGKQGFYVQIQVYQPFKIKRKFLVGDYDSMYLFPNFKRIKKDAIEMCQELLKQIQLVQEKLNIGYDSDDQQFYL